MLALMLSGTDFGLCVFDAVFGVDRTAPTDYTSGLAPAPFV